MIINSISEGDDKQKIEKKITKNFEKLINEIKENSSIQKIMTKF